MSDGADPETFSDGRAKDCELLNLLVTEGQVLMSVENSTGVLVAFMGAAVGVAALLVLRLRDRRRS